MVREMGRVGRGHIRTPKRDQAEVGPPWRPVDSLRAATGALQEGGGAGSSGRAKVTLASAAEQKRAQRVSTRLMRKCLPSPLRGNLDAASRQVPAVLSGPSSACPTPSTHPLPQTVHTPGRGARRRRRLARPPRRPGSCREAARPRPHTLQPRPRPRGRPGRLGCEERPEVSPGACRCAGEVDGALDCARDEAAGEDRVEHGLCGGEHGVDLALHALRVCVWGASGPRKCSGEERGTR